jgi:hypothetical protein
MDLKMMAERIRDTHYSGLADLFADCMAFDRALVMDMMQTPLFRPFKAELFTALRDITEWQRGDDRTLATFMQVDSAVSAIIESVRNRAGERVAA